MTVHHTVHTQVARVEDVNGRRRITEALGTVTTLPDKSFTHGKGALPFGSPISLLARAEVLVLVSDDMIRVELFAVDGGEAVAVIPATRSLSYDSSVPYRVQVEMLDPEGIASLEWFAFDGVLAPLGTPVEVAEDPCGGFPDPVDVAAVLGLGYAVDELGVPVITTLPAVVPALVDLDTIDLTLDLSVPRLGAALDGAQAHVFVALTKGTSAVPIVDSAGDPVLYGSTIFDPGCVPRLQLNIVDGPVLYLLGRGIASTGPNPN